MLSVSALNVNCTGDEVTPGGETVLSDSVRKSRPSKRGALKGGISRLGLIRPDLSFFVLFGSFPISPAICPICFFSFSACQWTYREHFRKDLGGPFTPG